MNVQTLQFEVVCCRLPDVVSSADVTKLIETTTASNPDYWEHLPPTWINAFFRVQGNGAARAAQLIDRLRKHTVINGICVGQATGNLIVNLGPRNEVLERPLGSTIGAAMRAADTRA